MTAPIDFNTPGAFEELMSYKKPEGGQPAQYDLIVQASIAFAKAIIANAPASGDRNEAIKCVRLARMWANSAIANQGKY